jgi:O-antigen ligase
MNILTKLNINMTLSLFCVVVLSLFFQSLTWGSVYRSLAYLALLLVIASYLIDIHQKNKDALKALLKYGLPFLALIVLEWLATQHFPWDIKAIRHVLLATGLMVAIALTAGDHERIKPYLIPTLIFSVYAYTLFQCVFIYMIGHMYGTTKNPHYLAIYSALFFVTATFLAVNWSRGIHRYGLMLSAVVLGYLLLNTSSRPTWIALMIATLIGIVCLRNRAQVTLIGFAGVVFALLFFSDSGNFKTRMDDLVMHAHKEERVTIWEDTWLMQQQNSPQQWLLGHGLESFEKDFQPYSRYYATEGIVYNSPHNALLEILYQFGWVGLVIVLGFILWLYFTLFNRYFRYHQQGMHEKQMVVLLLLSIYTITLVAVSITLPFFVSIHLNVIALVMGVMFYLDRREHA